MKTMKRLGCLLLVLAMCLALGVSVFASTVDTNNGGYGSIIINDAKEGETYSLYKMLDLTYDSTNESYAYTAAEGWNGFFTEGGAGSKYFDVDSNGGVTLKAGVTLTSGSSEMAELAKAALKFAKDSHLSAVASGVASEEGIQFINLTMGWYLVDTSLGSLCSIDTLTGSVEINEKNPTPTVTKRFEGDAQNEVDENKATVTYYLKIDNVANSVNVVLHDVMEVDGDEVTYTFDYDNMSVILYGGTNEPVDLTDKYTLKTGNDVSEVDDDNKCTFEVDLSEYDFSGCGEDAYVMVTISCELNAVGASFNGDELDIPNKAQVTYGNSSKSPWDRATVYEYGFEVFKYTEGESKDEKIALAGAHFELKNQNGETAYFTYEVNLDIYLLEGWGDVSDDNYTSDLVSGSDGYIKIEGLGDGTYTLTETKAPEGYNKLTNPITVTIKADEDDMSKFTVNGEGSHVVEVVNNAGASLPGTGGIGTTIFYVLGAILVCGAAVVLVTRRRVNGKAGSPRG